MKLSTAHVALLVGLDMDRWPWLNVDCKPFCNYDNNIEHQRLQLPQHRPVYHGNGIASTMMQTVIDWRNELHLRSLQGGLLNLHDKQAVAGVE